MSAVIVSQAWIVWLLAASILTLITRNPLYLLIILLAARLVDLVCGSRSQVVRLSFWRLALVILAFSTLFNVLLVHIGETVLLTLPPTIPLVGGPLTLEAALFGAFNALILITLLAIFLAFNRLVSTSDLVAMAPRAFANIGIVVLIAVSYIPETMQQLERIREAQAIRGHQVHGLRDWRPILIPLLIGGLERSMHVAETMVARGYGSTRDQPLSSATRSGVFLGMLLLFSGWLLSFWQVRPGWMVLITGAAVLLATIYRQNQQIKRSRYTVTRWQLTDYLVVILSIVPVALALLPIPGIDQQTLVYSPYPVFAAPAFDPVLGAAFSLLAAPAVIAELR